MYIYTIYKTTNLINDRYYIGVHKSKNPNDRYLGSGRSIKESIKKYGAANFNKEVLFTYDSYEAAYNKEAEIVTQELIDDPLSYNMTLGGRGGRSLSNDVKERIGNSNRGKKRSAELRKHMSESRKGRIPWNKGLKRSQVPWNKGLKGLSGTPCSEETKEKLRKHNLGKKHTEESKQKMSDTKQAKAKMRSQEERVKQ
jgi:hypothetical protein